MRVFLGPTYCFAKQIFLNWVIVPPCVRMVEKREKWEPARVHVEHTRKSLPFIYSRASQSLCRDLCGTLSTQAKASGLQALPQEQTYGTLSATQDVGFSSLPFCPSRPKSPSDYQDLVLLLGPLFKTPQPLTVARIVFVSPPGSSFLSAFSLLVHSCLFPLGISFSV